MTLCSDLNTQTKSRDFITSVNQTKVTDKSWQNRIRLKRVHLNIVCRNLYLVRCLVWLMEMLWGKNPFLVTETADFWIQKCLRQHRTAKMHVFVAIDITEKILKNCQGADFDSR